MHSHQQQMRIPVLPHLHQHLKLSTAWILVILIDMWWYLWISLMTYDMDHLFKFLFANCTLSLVRYLLKFLAYFWIRSLFSYCWVLGLIYKFWITVLYQMYLLQIFSPSLWLIFWLTWHFLPSVEVSNFMRSNNISYFFHGLYLWCFI